MPRGREDLLHYAGLAALFVLALAVPFAFGTLSILGSMGVFLLLLSWSISWRRQGGDTLAGVRDRSAWLFWGMAGVIAILIPIIAGTSYFLAVMVTFLIYLSWNVMWGLVLGTAGLQSFATVAVAGISAYVAGYLSVELGKSGNLACVGGGERILGVPVFQWWVAIPVAVLVGLIVGFIISLPAIRLRGIYFALLTIGLVELARAYVVQDKCNFGGGQGLYGASSFIPESIAGDLAGYQLAYVAAAGLAALALIIYWRVNYGRLGLLLRTARESEPVAEVLGTDIVRARLWVFLISSAVLGGAGGFYIAYYGSISPSFFNFSTVLFLFSMIMIGGINSPRGILVGTMLLMYVDKRFVDVDPPEARYVFIGLLLFVVTIVARDGLIAIPDQIRRRRGLQGRGTDPEGDPPEDVGAIEQEAHMPPGSRPEPS